jgi:Fe-S oxidoreductase
VFRDELLNLFPTHPDARLLASQTRLLSELLQQSGYRPPQLPRAALVHGHCHQKALMGMDAEAAILAAMGIEARAPESGCCGMAGAFGFESDHYAVSVACGERALLPAVRGAADDMLVIADGFSCREQIAQGTGRRALHLAQVLQLGLRQRR